MKVSVLLFVFVLLSCLKIYAQPNKMTILTSLDVLELSNLEPIAKDEELGLGVAIVTPLTQNRITTAAHKLNRCGGFTVISENSTPTTNAILSEFSSLKFLKRQSEEQEMMSLNVVNRSPRAQVQSALSKLSKENVFNVVKTLENFGGRYHKGANPNKPINEFKTYVENMLQHSGRMGSVELIQHRSTAQQSIRARIMGTKYPNEIIVLGGHIDSINMDRFNREFAPGADDNASGTATVLEVMRVVLESEPNERTIEFMWYGGEEGGLLGSNEIAASYRAINADVIGVIQLDMTLYPGEGTNTFVNMADYTNAWLRQYIESMNALYVKAKVVSGTCGYGCSDHASWHKQGYPAVMPSQGKVSVFGGSINPNIHTEDDKINDLTNFDYSMIFARLTLATVLELSNSRERAP